MSDLVPTDKDVSPILKMIREKHPDYHPLMAIADIAHNAKSYTSEGVEYEDQALALRCHQTIAKYCESEMKSIEVRGSIDHNLSTLRVVMDTTKVELLDDDIIDVDVLQPIAFEVHDAGD